MTTFAHLFGYTIAHATEDGKYLFKNASPTAVYTYTESLRIVSVPGVPVAGLALSTLTRRSRLPLLLPAWFPPHQRPPLAPLPRLQPQHPKMAKLTCTLGQNIPPSLSSRRSHNPTRAPTPSPHTPRSSRGSPILRAQGSTASLSPPRSPAFFASRTPSPAPSSSFAPSPTYATEFSSSAERVGSRAPSPAFPHNDYPSPTRVTYDEHEHDMRSERFLFRTFEFTEPRTAGQTGTEAGGTSTMYRRESRQGWGGEWGGAAQGLGMDEVVNQLRGLNMK